MATIPLSSIPTLSDLYKAGKLTQASPGETLTRPSAALNGKVSIIRASITSLEVTSIVNAANESLLGGGGIDGVIHRAAGPGLLAECRTLNGCRTGSAKITKGYNLPSQYVIHAVGPIYHVARRERPGSEIHLLQSCYNKCLNLAKEKGGSIAFNCLSTGIYGYPSDAAAGIAADEVNRWLREEGKDSLDRVVFCLFEEKDVRAYNEWLPRIFPPTPEELPGAKSEEIPKESEEGEGSGIIVQEGEAKEPAQKKAKILPQEPGKEEWEAVEKPEASMDKSREMSEEGEKVEQPDLAESEGEEVEKPKEDDVKTAAGFELVEDGEKVAK